MAEMLRDEDSSERHLSAARRHVRRCRKVKGAADFIKSIEPSMKVLTKATEASAASEAKEEEIRDDLDFAGIVASDAVRDVSEAAEKYDRNHPGEAVHAGLFPGGGFSDWLDSDGAVGPASLDDLQKRIAALPAAAGLGALADALGKHASDIRGLQKSLTEAVKERGDAHTDEEIAQGVLRRAYEDNYLDARKKLRRVAERLFPRIRRRARKTGEPERKPE